MIMVEIYHNVAASMKEACNCSFTNGNIVNESGIMCMDSINAEVGMRIKPVLEYSQDQLICQFKDLLSQRRNVIDLGESIIFTYHYINSILLSDYDLTFFLIICVSTHVV